MKESYLTKAFRKTAHERFPEQEAVLNSAFEKRLGELRSEHAGAGKERLRHLESQILPLQETDTGMFNRVYYLSDFYDLRKPALVVSRPQNVRPKNLAIGGRFVLANYLGSLQFTGYFEGVPRRWRRLGRL